MGRPKGFRPPGAGMGRKKGIPNKFTKTFKDLIKNTLLEIQELHGTGVPLKEWAQNNPTEFYKIAARLIPIEATVTSEQTVITVDVQQVRDARAKLLDGY